MLAELSNHLWQSTAFAAVVALATMGFRQNRAHVRYWMWLSASMKFLLPFGLLLSLGHRLEWAPAVKAPPATAALSVYLLGMSQPFPDKALPIASAANAHDWLAILLLAVWACGFAAIALIRGRGWRRVRAALRASTPIDVLGTLHIRSAPGLLEPGVVGFFHPVLLLPADIAAHLEPAQWAAVLAHERCHVRRRDNLTSLLHMLVESVFWFHPLVWWIGGRLIEERERACDEAVLSLGNLPQAYAQAILNVCKSYLESPLSCVAGITGWNLKKRIQAILTGGTARELTFARKMALTAGVLAAVAVPVAIGIGSAPHMRAQAPAAQRFETASIKPCNAYTRSDYLNVPAGTFHSGCTTVQHLILQAYGLFADGHMHPLAAVTTSGGPAWADSDLYEIEAEAEGAQSRPVMNGPMLQTLLEDRFKLRLHHETRPVPVYELTVASGGLKAPPFQGSCTPWDWDHPDPAATPVRCATSRAVGNSLDLDSATMADLCLFFLVTLDRPVIDETGAAGRFNFHLNMPTKVFAHGPFGIPSLGDPTARATDSALIASIKNAAGRIGLLLQPAEGPGEFLVIDQLERPSGT
jgi:bla regulator protein BlaR1